MIKLTINNRQVDVPEGTTVLQAAETIGIHIPRFCYHKWLSIAGNCRMCLVEIEGAKNPVISCKEVAREGMVVRTDSEMVKRAMKDVLEFVLLNHPVDCPICDQSGECDLQDYYFDHSLRPSRLIEEKVHKPKAQVLGPHVILDAERCVECTRCVRFCEEIAGVHEIGLFERGDHSTIGVIPGEELKNPYSLCTADLCPVGALTSRDFRFRKRVWFLKSTPSICLGCATGCNIWIDHCDSIVWRYRPRENEAVNKLWLCDYGRMTYKRLLPENRLLEPMIRRDGGFVPASWDDALVHVGRLFKEVAASEIVGILSAGSSNEENAAFAEMCRNVFKATRILWSGAKHDLKFGDTILRDVDQNPNTAGVQKITDKRMSDLKSNAAYIILDELSDDDQLALAASRPALVVLVTSRLPNGSTMCADVMLPKTTHAEQEGSFINRSGMVQRPKAAFAPIGQTRPVSEVANSIRKVSP